MIYLQLALDKATQCKGKAVDIEVMAVSFNDEEWQTSPEEEKFTSRSLEMVKIGIPFRRLFILDGKEIKNMILNQEYGGVITKHCRHKKGRAPFIDAKIIRDDEQLVNALREQIKRFGSGFFCIKVDGVYFLIYDIDGDGSRGHVFIDQEKSKEIVESFNQVWKDGCAKDFTDEIHSLYDEQVHKVCFEKCSTTTKCKHLGGNN